MVDMGVPSYLVAGSVIGILAQRLVRVVCAKCKQPDKLSESQLEAGGITAEQAREATCMRGQGCASCQNTGYRGRLGIFELMPLTAKVRELAFQNASMQAIRKEAISAGMSTLYDDGIDKVLRGITTLEEVFRVAKRERGD